MPCSSIHGKELIYWTVDGLSKESPLRRALDVGTGAGLYSINLRRPGQEWYGIEIWAPYIKQFGLNEKYDKLIVADARYVDYSLLGPFDIAFCGDVLEHMEKGEAVQLVEKLLKFSRFVFISLPVVYLPQGEENGNPFEAHVKPDWTIEEAKAAFPSVVVAATHEKIGVLILAAQERDGDLVSRAVQNAFNYLSSQSAGAAS
jgi:2-polyprenyl-3-methyl-5-hydroxy-6-metoxy-1,4-benzoquinol methylase